MLEGYGYKLGKLYQRGVLFKDYHPRDEDFMGPNYVACLASETEALARLSL